MAVKSEKAKERRRLANLWRHMMERCYDTKFKQFKNYGGRGIAVCERWHNVCTFIDDMHPRPCGMTVDRIDNNKGYSQENCRWATRAEQSRNTQRNITLVVDGVAMVMKDACALKGIAYNTVRKRIVLRGWSAERALNTAPIQSSRLRLPSGKFK